jgi:putative peptidoglycan lipid II flippase
MAVAVNVTFSLLLPGGFARAGWPTHAGLALANALATLLELGVLMALINRRLAGIEGHATLVAAARSGLAAIGMGAALVVWQIVLSRSGNLVVAVGGMIVGTAVYFGLALLLRIEQLQQVLSVAKRRLHRRPPESVHSTPPPST